MSIVNRTLAVVFLCNLAFRFTLSSAPEQHGPVFPFTNTPRHFSYQTVDGTLCAGSISCQGPIDASVNETIKFCESVQGDVVVSGPLRHVPRCLQRIESGGSLVVEENSFVTSLNGFGVLERIGGDVRIVNNPFLVSLRGLDRLEQVNGDVYIVANGRATTLSFIDALVYASEDSGKTLVDLSRRNSLAELTDDHFHLPRRVRRGQEPGVGGILPIDPLHSALFPEDSLAALVSLHGLGSLRRIIGQLYIANNTDLRTMHGAERLEEIGGFRIERNALLQTMDGLRNVTKVWGDLAVRSNPSLESLSGLESLVSVAGSVIMKDNDGLREVGNLANLEQIGGDVEIRRNYNLRVISASGYLGVTEINGSFYIEGNPHLRSCSGLQFLQRVEQDVAILQNPLLHSLEQGFDSLNRIGGNLFIQGNMLSLQGLEALESILGSLYLHSLPSLEMVTGLNGLRVVGHDVLIYLNQNLISVGDLQQLRSIGGDALIHDNNKLANVTGLMEALHNVQGYFLIDYAYGRIDCPRGSGTRLGQTNMMQPDISYNLSYGNWCTVSCREPFQLQGNVQDGVSVSMWQCQENDFWNRSWAPSCL